MQHTLKLRTAILVFASLAMAVVPSIAWALGLGEIQSDTRIGQSFSAQIPILNASTGELQGLSVSLADHAAYQSAKISEPDYLFSLKFSVAQGPKGPYIRVTSNKPIKLPFLNLLIRASWASGQVMRQYTVLLNPPTFVSGSGAQQQPVSTVNTPVPAKSVPVQQAAQQPAPTPVSPPRKARPAASVAPVGQPMRQAPHVTSMPSSYTVHKGDTLWGIARQLHDGTGATVNQTMVAIYRANPQAFHGNINRLDAGRTLKVPTHTEIAQVEAEYATRLVARQNDEWRGAGSAPQVAANSGVPEQPIPATTGQAASEEAPPQPVVAPTSSSVSTQAAGSQAAKSETSGRVVLTTPEVTAAKSVASAPGSSAVAGTAVVGAAGAMGTTQKNRASATRGAAIGMAGTGASAGGPIKVKNNAMAEMAAAPKSVAAGNAVTAAKPKSKFNTPNSVNSVNSVNTSGQEQGSGLMYWLQRPGGWIVIAAIILVLIAILLLILRQRRKADEQPVSLVAMGGEQEADGHANEFGMESDDAATDERSALESKENFDDIGLATYLGGSSLDVNKVDAEDEADLHIGFGDYGKAAQILRDGLEQQPQRKELRRKLLDVLFAAGEGSAFSAEARVYIKEADGAADWQEVVAMGRQLCPHDEFFTDNATSAETSAENAADSSSDDFAHLDLDRLGRDEDENKEQDEFERTMDELSTFIETYVPASAEPPVALQLPPDEMAREVETTSETDEAELTLEDEPLDFHLDDEDLPPVTSEATVEGEADEPESMVDT
ncbi:MAG: FimV/HubP family polar landmark protein, partial [Gammaproteobacteria bacterium]